MITALQELIHNNQFLAGGIVLGMIAAMLAMLKKVPGYLYQKLKNYLLISVQIEEKQEPYAWIMRWLSQHPKRFKYRTVTSLVLWRDHPKQQGAMLPEVSFIPNGGIYCFWSSWTPFWISVVKEQKMLNDFALGEKKSLTIYKLGKSKKVLDDLLQIAYALHTPDDFKSIRVFYFMNSFWTSYHDIAVRSGDTLCYDSDIIKHICDDAARFIERKEWYRKMGIPYRRGYLFYGDPGNGKTSLAILIASKLRMNICVLNIASLENDAQLTNAVLTLPPKTLLLLEDVDAAGVGRTSDNGAITFSGLLNSLDGISAGEGRILVMTTNHRDLLDPALIRPGRADVAISIRNAGTYQVREMFKRFFSGVTEAQQDRFVTAIPDRSMSMSRLQELLLESHGPDDAIRRAGLLLIAA